MLLAVSNAQALWSYVCRPQVSPSSENFGIGASHRVGKKHPRCDEFYGHSTGLNISTTLSFAGRSLKTKRAMRRCTYSVLWHVRRNHGTFDFRMHAESEGSGQTLCRRKEFLLKLRSCETTCIHRCPKITHAQLSCDHIVGYFQKQSCYGFRCVQCHD